MTTAHPSLAAGRWQTLSLVEQFGNIGSEVGRALRWHARGEHEHSLHALDRALELFDLTITDPRWRTRLKEPLRAREIVCDYFFGGNTHRSTAASLEQYFMTFATAARMRR
ncbi:hypothetical protein HY624_01940 [Candidatus Uhrbacteria bacterium]|nr:hypothetical protein [Candidatus Uhrbacteria bacterium]